MNKNQPTHLARRQWLVSTSSAAGLGMMAGMNHVWAAGESAPVAAKTLPTYVNWKNPDAMIIHSASTLETRRTALGTGPYTPTNALFIRNNLPAPDASFVGNRDAWVVAVEGVKNPRTFTLKDLKAMPAETVSMVLQCSGNGRGYFPSKPSGTPWQVGAAGCVAWTGVPVRELIKRLGGVSDGMVYMTGTGGEKMPENIDPITVMVERSVPLKAFEDAVLAWDMNGEPIPLAHGGPLRLIVPGYTGVNNVKYIKRLAFTVEQSQATIQRKGYRISPPGEKGDDKFPSVWEMSVKSWIVSPAPDNGTVSAGPVPIRGVAFGGANALRSVHVTIDDGQTWHKARMLGPDLGKYAWRPFEVTLNLEPGYYSIACQAKDMEGNIQPAGRSENAGGYNNNSWRDHALAITVY